MVKKVSLHDVAATVNGFEETVRTQLGPTERGARALTAINAIRLALNELGETPGTSDHIFCLSDQIICDAGGKNKDE
jgi:hypothetical protein